MIPRAAKNQYLQSGAGLGVLFCFAMRKVPWHLLLGRGGSLGASRRKNHYIKSLKHIL
jgi:hypothetical protein